MPADHQDYCAVRIRAYTKRIFSGEEVLEIIGPPVAYENGGIQQSVPPTNYDKSATFLGTFLISGPILPPLPSSVAGGAEALKSYIKSLEQYGCEVKEEE